MSEEKQLLAYFPAHEITVSLQGEDLQIDHPDIIDEELAAEAGRFVLHLLAKETEALATIQANEDWARLDKAFAEWRRKRGLR